MDRQDKEYQALISEISFLKQKIKALEQWDSASRGVNDALRASEEKYRFIAENTVDIISISDMNLRTTYVSPSVSRIRGFTGEEVKQQSLSQILTPESLQKVYSVFAEEMELEASGTANL